MGLADDLLEDARNLAERGIGEGRQSLLRRAISTAYYAVFHQFVEDFVEHWEFADQRARLGRMFSHSAMSAGFTPKDAKNPAPLERELTNVIKAFGQLQRDRERADYDVGWTPVETDVWDAITRAEDVFAKWRSIRHEDLARHHLLSMFGGKRG